MKVTIKRAAAIFIVSMLCMMTAVPAYAFVPWIDDGIIYLSPVTLDDGTELKEVSAGETVTLKCRMKAGIGLGENANAALIVSAQKDGKVLKEEVAQAALTAYAQTVSVSIDIPTDADAVKVFVWDSLLNRRPLAAAGVVGGDVTVSGITIGGKPIEGFDPEVTEYDAEVAAAYLNYPPIVVQTSDALAKTEIVSDDPYPADKATVTAKVIKNGKTVKSYRINLTRAAAEVSDIRYKQWDSSYSDYNWVRLDEKASANPETTVILKNPTEYNPKMTLDMLRYSKADELVGNSESTYPTGAIQPYCDRSTFFLYDISPELEGATFIRWAFGERLSSNSDKVKNDGNAAEFEINRSATVYISCATQKDSNPLNFGWTEVNSGSPSYYYSGYNTDKDSNKGANALMWRCQIDNSNYVPNRLAVSYWYKKSFEVDPEVGKTTVSIPALKTFQYHIAVKFDDAPLVKNPEYADGDGNTKQTDVLRGLYKPVMLDKDKLAEIKGEDQSERPFLKTALYSASMFSNRQNYGAADFSDELVGAEVIRLPFNNQGSKDDTVNGLQFDLIHSARIYVAVRKSTTEAEWQRLIDDGYTFANENPVNSWALSPTAQPSPALEGYKTAYKDYQVQPGEKLHINLDGVKDFGAGKQILVMAKEINVE